MGTTLREIVEEIGGGLIPKRREEVQAARPAAPSGGCIP